MSNEKQERIDRIQKTMKVDGNCEYRTNPYTNELADHDELAFAWVHVNGYHLRACIGPFRAGNFEEVCNCAVPGQWNTNNEYDVQFGDPELMRYTAAEWKMAENAFGVCPTCQKTDGYANVRALHIFFCIKHRVRWKTGVNIFSSWRDQTEDEQRYIYDTVGLGGFTDVEPYMIEEVRDLPIVRAILYKFSKHWPS